MAKIEKQKDFYLVKKLGSREAKALLRYSSSCHGTLQQIICAL